MQPPPLPTRPPPLPPPPSEPSAPPPPAAASADADLSRHLGNKVGRSMAWMIGASLFIKVMSLAAQIVMGWYLSEGDFGVYAIAFAFIGVATFVREGGARDYLIQQGPGRYGVLVGPLFWMAMVITLMVASSLVLLACSIAVWPGLFPESYRDPRLPALLLVGAAAVTLATPSAFTSARLQVELRFDQLARVQLGSGVIRYAVTIGLAMAGLGPLAFMLAYLAVQVFELGAFAAVVKVNLWRLPRKPHLWRSYLVLTIWLAVGFFGNFLVEWGNAAAVGIFASGESVGVYYFAFNLVVQLVLMLSVNAQYVLMPALARLNGQPERQSAAILRVTRALVLVASGLCLGFAVIGECVTEFLWHGKWDAAVLAVQIFGIFFPMRMTYGLTLAVMQAKGEFKRWALTSVAEAAAMFAAAAAGGWIGTNVSAVRVVVDNPAAMSALCIGVTLAVVRVLVTGDTLKRAGIGVGARIGAQFPAWVLAIAAAGACWWIDHHAVGPEGWHALHSEIMGVLNGHRRWAEMGTQLVRGGSLAALFGVLYTALVRVVLPGHVKEAVAFAPARLKGPAMKLLRVRADA